MGIFFTDGEETLITKIKELNDAAKIAKTALEYTSQNEKHLVEFYRRELDKIAAKYDPAMLFTIFKNSRKFKTDKETIQAICKALDIEIEQQ